jgi:hypothetical protein
MIEKLHIFFSGGFSNTLGGKGEIIKTKGIAAYQNKDRSGSALSEIMALAPWKRILAHSFFRNLFKVQKNNEAEIIK